jgi:hypothetical protein
MWVLGAFLKFWYLFGSSELNSAKPTTEEEAKRSCAQWRATGTDANARLRRG